MRSKEIDKAKDWLNHIESSVITKENNLPFYDFKKNNEYSTLWDDKKLLAKKNSMTPIQNNNSYGSQNLNNAYNKYNKNNFYSPTKRDYGNNPDLSINNNNLINQLYSFITIQINF